MRASEEERAHFRAVLRRTIETAANWPRRADRKLKIDPLPHGWLLPLLLEIETACWGRWDHWMRLTERGTLEDEPIPRIEFCADSKSPARRMHENALNQINGYGSWEGWDSWRLFDYYLDWLLYGFGDSRQKDPPPEPEDGAFGRLYQSFCLEAMLAWPSDHFGELMAENRHGRGSGFYPTPHCVVELMTRINIGSGGDARTKAVCDSCVGTGRMLLHASNHSYRLYGQDINPTVIKACLVNGYCFAPWMVKPFRFLERAEPDEESTDVQPSASSSQAPARQLTLFDDF